MLIGQGRLKAYFDTVAIGDRYPHFAIFVGPKGQGKRTFVKELLFWNTAVDIYLKENVKVEDVREIIEDSQTLHKKRFYVLPDAQDMTVQAQNALLKLVEEPNPLTYVFMTTTSLEALLPTIRSRAQVFVLDPYTKAEMLKFTDDPILLTMCENPGQVRRLEDINYKEIYDHAKKVVDNIGRVSLPNVFNILNHVEEDNYDVFLNAMVMHYSDLLKAGDRKVLQEMNIIYSRRPYMNNKSINKKNLLEMMLVSLRDAAMRRI